MQADNWKENLLSDMNFHIGHRSDIIEDIFSCQEQDILSTPFTLSQCIDIAKKLNVPVEELGHGVIDWQAIKSQYFSEKFCIPEQYTHFAGSHMSSVRSIISFFESRFTSRASQSLLQQLDIHQDVLLNDRVKLNNNFINNMFQLMTEEYSLSKADIDLMSVMVHRYSMRSSVLKMAKSCPSNGSILKLMIENATKYEMNNDYYFEQKNNHVVITSKSRYPINEANHHMCPMNEPLVYFKLCTFKHVTSLMGREPIKISAHELSLDRGHQILKIKFDETDQLSSFRHNMFH
jgi:hypothetical protein